MSRALHISVAVLGIRLRWGLLRRRLQEEKSLKEGTFFLEVAQAVASWWSWAPEPSLCKA